ncbi:hypothetical protein F4804DRAFT_136804 [Jackrogersella minutella]|nr:hypothetical protein F4804DRAFT_136804 [Jackrogersella minutella]
MIRDGEGMQSDQTRMPSFQIQNPKLTYISSQRNLPAPGFRPTTLLIGVGAIMIFGFYKLGKGIKEQNELAREKMWSRIHLIPLLQAEEDRDQVRRYLADQAREKELMGENMKVYNSDRFVRPTYAVTPTNVTK